MKRVLLIIILCFVNISISAQADSINFWSIWNSNSLSAKAKIDSILITTDNVHILNQSDSVILYSNKIKELCEQLNLNANEAWALKNRGLAFRQKGDYINSLSDFNEAKKILESLDDKKKLADINANISTIYRTLGDYTKALEYALKSYNYGIQTKDQFLITKGSTTIAHIYTSIEEYEKALQYYKIALDLNENSPEKNTRYIIIDLVNTSGIYARLKDYERAYELTNRALTLSQNENYKSLEGNTLYMLGFIAKDEGQYDKAINYFKKSLSIAKDLKSKRSIFSNLDKLGAIYTLKEDYKKSLFYCNQAYELANDLKVNELTKSACDCLYKAYKGSGNINKAFYFFEQVSNLKDSINFEKNSSETILLSTRYEYETKALQDSIQYTALLTLQNTKNKNRRVVIYILLVGLAFTLLLGGLLFNRFKVTQAQKKIIELEKLKLNEANEKLTDLDKAKSKIYTNISHEFRTPLTIISGLTELMEGEEKNKYIIKSNTDKLLNLVNQMLDLRKLESSAMSLQLQQGNIILLINYLVQSFSSYAQSKSISIEYNSNESEIVMDYDPEKISRIITNLLSNAIKFTPKSGLISINTKRENNLLNISIRDTGHGIPRDKISKIFEQFYRVEDQNEESTYYQSGTGIGLTLVKELVDLMKGNITVDSKLNEGTTFIVNLPITNESNPQNDYKLISPYVPALNYLDNKTSSNEYLENPEKPNLLIIEDNLDVIHYLETCLSNNYQLLISNNGQQGIDTALMEIPDLILSDVMMPFKDGFEVCKILKEDEKTSHIPIILLTGKADMESKLEGLKRGADLYLSKPFNKEELLISLKNLYDLRKKIQQKYSSFESKAESNKNDIDNIFIDKVRQIVLENINNDDFSIAQLCSILEMSRTQLHKKIKALTGRSTSLIVRLIRLQKAQEILKTSNNTISETAYQVGFKDSSHFSRYFTQEFGISPSQFRSK